MLPIEIPPRDLAALRREVAGMLLLDCREPEEHELVAIGGDTLIPMGQMPGRLGELAGRESERIVVYCHLGGRSLRVAMWLRQQGFTHAQSLAGGVDAWATEIGPGMVRY